MARKKLPEGLENNQKKQRQETYEKIEAAARELREDGRAITRPSLTAGSGLAPSTFSKKHVKQYILKRWGIGADEVATNELPSPKELDEKEFGEILKKFDDLRKRLCSTEGKLEKERDLRKEAKVMLDEREHEVKVLRGKLDIALRQLRISSVKKKKGELIKLFESEGPGASSPEP